MGYSLCLYGFNSNLNLENEGGVGWDFDWLIAVADTQNLLCARGRLTLLLEIIRFRNSSRL